MIDFFTLALASLVGMVVGLWAGYQFTMHVVEEWIEDHVAKEHRG